MVERRNKTDHIPVPVSSKRKLSSTASCIDNEILKTVLELYDNECTNNIIPVLYVNRETTDFCTSLLQNVFGVTALNRLTGINGT